MRLIFFPKCWKTKLCYASANLTNMGLIGVKFDLFLAFTEPLSDKRRIPGCFTSIILFVILKAHDMEFWDFKILIFLKFHPFISGLLEFWSCVFSSSHFQIQRIIPVTSDEDMFAMGVTSTANISISSRIF